MPVRPSWPLCQRRNRRRERFRRAATRRGTCGLAFLDEIVAATASAMVAVLVDAPPQRHGTLEEAGSAIRVASLAVATRGHTVQPLQADATGFGGLLLGFGNAGRG